MLLYSNVQNFPFLGKIHSFRETVPSLSSYFSCDLQVSIWFSHIGLLLFIFLFLKRTLLFLDLVYLLYSHLLLLQPTLIVQFTYADCPIYPYCTVVNNLSANETRLHALLLLVLNAKIFELKLPLDWCIAGSEGNEPLIGVRTRIYKLKGNSSVMSMNIILGQFWCFGYCHYQS